MIILKEYEPFTSLESVLHFSSFILEIKLQSIKHSHTPTTATL